MRDPLDDTLRWTARFLVGLAFIVGMLQLLTEPAEAATRVTYVDVAVSSTWSAPVRDSLNWVDKFTGSDMVFGRCRTGYKCIIIREGQVCCGSYGWTTYQKYWSYNASDRPRILLDPDARGWPDWLQRRLVAHELGHANGITWHAKYCSNIMWAYRNCANGAYPAWRFTDPMLARLRVN